MAEQYSIVYIFHIFLIQLSVDGHLVSGHVLKEMERYPVLLNWKN